MLTKTVAEWEAIAEQCEEDRYPLNSPAAAGIRASLVHMGNASDDHESTIQGLTPNRLREIQRAEAHLKKPQG